MTSQYIEKQLFKALKY